MTHTTPIAQEPVDVALQARAAGYLLFARLFREAPPPELLQAIVQHRWFSNAEDPHRLDQAEAIAVEYARLFVVPGEQAVRPYESVYCDTLSIDTSTACSAYFENEPLRGGLRGFIGGPSATAVREAYRHAGFELDAACHELPDHLAIELEFMGRLLERGKTDEARVFFTAHLGRWVFRCLNDLKRTSGSGFYRVVADSLAAFLQHEHNVLDGKV